MHDLLYIVTIVLWVAVAWLTTRLPVWPAPPTTYQQAAAQQRVGCVIGGFLLLFVVAGAGIGYAISQFIAVRPACADQYPGPAPRRRRPRPPRPGLREDETKWRIGLPDTC
jgi:hypothetical protein